MEFFYFIIKQVQSPEISNCISSLNLSVGSKIDDTITVRPEVLKNPVVSSLQPEKLSCNQGTLNYNCIN